MFTYSFFCQALQAAIKNLTSSIKKQKDKIVAMQTALELDSEVMKPTEPIFVNFFVSRLKTNQINGKGNDFFTISRTDRLKRKTKS